MKSLQIKSEKSFLETVTTGATNFVDACTAFAEVLALATKFCVEAKGVVSAIKETIFETAEFFGYNGKLPELTESDIDEVSAD